MTSIARIASAAAASGLLLSLPAAAAEAPDPFQALAAACQKGDVPAALARFTDDGSIRLSVEGMPDELFEGRSWIRVFWEIHSRGCKLEVGVSGPDGAALTLANERFRALGAPQVAFKARVTLRGDEIAQLHLVLDAAQAPTVARAVINHNRAVVLRFSDKVNRKEEQSAVDECVASEYVQHSIMPVAAGVQGLREFYTRFRKAFPDVHYTTDDTRAEGDTVAVRMTVRMTHRGEFMGIPATGNPIIITKMDFWRLMSGKVVEHWDAVDRLGLLQQIGVVPKLTEWQTSPGFEGFR
ncbi:MAG TPA: ester cyclase [Myxococcaceae bacterium]|jgi:predicted ester cyclase